MSDRRFEEMAGLCHTTKPTMSNKHTLESHHKLDAVAIERREILPRSLVNLRSPREKNEFRRLLSYVCSADVTLDDSKPIGQRSLRHQSTFLSEKNCHQVNASIHQHPKIHLTLLAFWSFLNHCVFHVNSKTLKRHIALNAFSITMITITSHTSVCHLGRRLFTDSIT